MISFITAYILTWFQAHLKSSKSAGKNAHTNNLMCFLSAIFSKTIPLHLLPHHFPFFFLANPSSFWEELNWKLKLLKGSFVSMFSDQHGRVFGALKDTERLYGKCHSIWRIKGLSSMHKRPRRKSIHVSNDVEDISAYPKRWLCTNCWPDVKM